MYDSLTEALDYAKVHTISTREINSKLLDNKAKQVFFLTIHLRIYLTNIYLPPLKKYLKPS